MKGDNAEEEPVEAGARDAQAVADENRADPWVRRGTKAGNASERSDRGHWFFLSSRKTTRSVR